MLKKKKKQMLMYIVGLLILLSIDTLGFLKYSMNREEYKVIKTEILYVEDGISIPYDVVFEYASTDGSINKGRVIRNFWENKGDVITVAVPINSKSLRFPQRITYMPSSERIVLEVFMVIKIVSSIIDIRDYKKYKM